MGISDWWKNASEKTLEKSQAKRIQKLKDDRKKINDLKTQKAKLQKSSQEKVTPCRS